MSAVDTLYMRDGTTEQVWDEGQFKRLIDERLGTDAAEYYQAVLDDIRAEVETEMEKETVPAWDVWEAYKKFKDLRQYFEGLSATFGKFAGKKSVGVVFETAKETLDSAVKEMNEAMLDLYVNIPVKYVQEDKK